MADDRKENYRRTAGPCPFTLDMQIRDEKVIHKYLQTYAEPESNSLPELPQYDHCLVIPVFDETFENLERVWHRIKDNYLVVLVVNAPWEHHIATIKLVQEATSRAKKITSSGRCKYLSGTPDILPEMIQLFQCQIDHHLK